MARGLAAFCLVWALVVGTGGPAASAASPAVTFHMASVAGYRLAAAGGNWPHHARVAVLIHTGGWTRAVVLRTAKNGGFRVGANQVDICTGATFDAYAAPHLHVTVHSPPLMCPPMAQPPIPVLTVLKGTRIAGKQVRVLAPHGPQPVTLHLGDTLYLWEPGTDRPAFSAHADEAFLAPIANGTTPARQCPEVDCAAGFYWVWLGVRTGETGIDLSPACRQSTPACGLPDFLLEVHIAR